MSGTPTLRRSLQPLWLGSMLAVLSLSAQAQGTAAPSPVLNNVASLSADGTVEVQQDEMRMVLSTTRQGRDAASVQSQLRQALDAALQVARPQARDKAMSVQTGNFSLYPTHDRDGRINQWQGSAELVLSGNDMPRISQTAGRIQTMTIAGISFDVSRDLRRRTETEAQTLAIHAFRVKAQSISRGFGFNGYGLREVSVTADGSGGVRPMAVRAMAFKAGPADAPVPVEPGKSTVRVVVQGSVQMH